MIIQSALFFILGVALTMFLLILLAPLIWRRMSYFIRKNLRNQMPLSLKEAQSDKQFMKARHAVELARYQERHELLQRINDEQRLRLQKNEEQIKRLNELQGKTSGIQEKLVVYDKKLSNERKKVDEVVKAQGKNAKEMRDLYFSEKLVRLDVANYETVLAKLTEQIEDLSKKHDKLAKSFAKTKKAKA